MAETRDQIELLGHAASRRVKRRLEAVQRLPNEPPGFAIPVLLRLLNDSRSNVQEAAGEALRTMPDPRGRAALVTTLDDPYEWTRVMAATALAVEHEPRAWTVLEEALDSEDLDIHPFALDGLFRLDKERALELTERIVRERTEEPRLREMAVRTLVSEGSRRSLPALRTALTDRSRYVRQAAREAIETIEAVQAFTMSEHSDLHATVRDLASAVLAERRSGLADAGLRTRIEIERCSKRDRETSELRVVFWRDTAFIDIVEMFIVQDGHAVGTPAEFRQWLEEDIDGIIAEHRGG